MRFWGVQEAFNQDHYYVFPTPIRRDLHIKKWHVTEIFKIRVWNSRGLEQHEILLIEE
jgi:DUF1365 family protein